MGSYQQRRFRFRGELVRGMLEKGIPEPAVQQLVGVFERVDRTKFLQSGSFGHMHVHEDSPAQILASPIPNQIYQPPCSQPSTVALFCHLLDLKPGDNVLEVGTGCGYHAAITLEHIIWEEKQGHLTTIEYFEELAQFGQKNLQRHLGDKFNNHVMVLHEDGLSGYQPNAPYDAIYFTAGVDRDGFSMRELVSQEKEGGKILLPIHFRGEKTNVCLVMYQIEKQQPLIEAFIEGYSFIPIQ